MRWWQSTFPSDEDPSGREASLLFRLEAGTRFFLNVDKWDQVARINLVPTWTEMKLRKGLCVVSEDVYAETTGTTLTTSRLVAAKPMF